MAHELTIRRNGKAEMAFTGETPWHGLGQPVTVGASIGVWQREAGMDWDALEVDLLGKRTEPRGFDISFPAYKGIVRSDSMDALSIVGSKYELVQPKAVLEFFRDLTEGGGWDIHTAGTLRGGRKIWAMASNGEGGIVRPRGGLKNPSPRNVDEVRQNLLLATSLDGSMKTQAILTSVRVVCANTLALALTEGGNAVKISHRSVFDPNAIKRALGVARESFEVFMEQAREMADTPVKLDAARDALRQIFGEPTEAKPAPSWLGSLSQAAAPAPEPEAKERRSVDRVLELFNGAGMGADLPTAKGTAWGLLNAVTQYVDHEMGRTRDTRLDSAWFGEGSRLKQSALDAILETV